MIAASTAALLGTSAEAPPPSFFTTYTFERGGIDGGFVELTRDLPSATFFVTVRADDLGPDGVVTTKNALALLDGSFMSSGLAEGEVLPLVKVKTSSPDTSEGSERFILDHYLQGQALVFTGDCESPKSGAVCMARFRVELSRQDDGASGGVVRFDWMFNVESKVDHPSEATGTIGPLDPPWTIEVKQP